MLPRTSSAIPIIDPGSRTGTPKKSVTPPPTVPKSPPESPSATKSLGVHAPVFVPRFTTAPEPVSHVSTPQPPETPDDPFTASYHHVQYEPGAYAPYYAPLLGPYALEPLDFHNYHPILPRNGMPRPYFMTPDLRDELHRKQDALYQAPHGHPSPPLPDEVHAYHSLVLLEPTPGQGFLGSLNTSVYRANVEEPQIERDGAQIAVCPMIRPSPRSKHGQACRTRASSDHTRLLLQEHLAINVPFITHLSPHCRADALTALVVVYEYHPLARTLQSHHCAPSTPPLSNSRSQQSSPAKSRTFSPARNFSPGHFGPGSPTSQFPTSPSFNTPAFATGSTFGSPAQPYGFPQSFSFNSFQSPTARANSLPPSASITHALSQSASFTSFSGPFSPQFPPQMQPRPTASGSIPFSQQVGAQPLDERTLWTYLLQLASAVRVVHARGMALRCLDPKRVLVTGVGRINTVGIVDILMYDGQPTLEVYMQDDLISLGTLLIQLCQGSSNSSQLSAQSIPQSPNNPNRGGRNANSSQTQQIPQPLASQQGPAQALARFSPLLRQAVIWLITPGVAKTIEHLFKEISPAIIGAEMDAMLDQADALESELSRELENGRLVRLLCKFGFINERPEFDHDPRWAETGDRYIIKLFRDHVFHQVDARGKPVLNLTHVFVNLNKLDAGSDERLMLVSRDERNCLVVSYKEIKTCIENAYRDLAK
ncbi:PAB-dependent poly(A)-specific ribonuclease subunit 3 [Ceratobasidium theobromae]|uniref:PAB-dependent poly(A)-specific ribonuclease subunit 3 n=1 Tax=Ceratobasidium theobromae TaxID=1582974 RepID=A0A5N5QEC8_9AGAM|nr:PAB-dependent poly(A)-specific ribonuclease subunit 3 [Ceratobasidium theobromae]